MNKTKKYWTVTTIIALVMVGLMNTVLLRPEDVGTWKNYVGYAFLILAVLNIIYLFRQFKMEKR